MQFSRLHKSKTLYTAFWSHKADILKKSTFFPLTKESYLFWFYKIMIRLENASFYQAFPTNKINSTEYANFADNLLNKHHESVFTEKKKKHVYLSHTEKCTNEGFSSHLFPNKTVHHKKITMFLQKHIASHKVTAPFFSVTWSIDRRTLKFVFNFK